MINAIITIIFLLATQKVPGTFGEMFEKTIAVIYGVIHPREAVAFCDLHQGTAETDLYRPFILGLWRGNPEQWGEVEKSA